MKIAVLEFLCGGGLIEPDQPRTDPNTPANVLVPLFGEGLSMLDALATDFIECGHSVFTCLDRSVLTSALVPPSFLSSASISIVETTDRFLDVWGHVASDCDVTVVIAPELNNALASIVQTLRALGVTVLASDAAFLKAASDKRLMAKMLLARGVAHPATWTLREYYGSREAAAKTIGTSPITVKRRDGAGCAEMRYFANCVAFESWASTTSLLAENADHWIVQPWIDGQPASLALIAQGSRKVLGAFEQRMEVRPIEIANQGQCVQYRGGSGPLAQVSFAQLEEFANVVLNAVPPGAAGWIGIDFLIPLEAKTARDWIAIEINPRLTTSYAGYRKWYGHELANMLLGIRPVPSSVGFPTWERIEFDA